MSEIFLIGDTHFGDSNIIRYENRPFQFTEEMDEELIRLWNETVNKDDLTYVVGDFGAEGYEADILSALNGTKFLIKGNHDEKNNKDYREYGFEEVYDKPIILNEFLIVSHLPQYVNERSPYANAFAHVHGSPIYKDYSGYHYCVSAERTGFKPVRLKTVIDTILKERGNA